MKYAWIDAQRRAYPLPAMCETLAVSASCQGQPKFPQLCKLNFPHPVHESFVSSARTRPALSFSLRRYELPRMFSVTA
jgi:hypothetical protein